MNKDNIIDGIKRKPANNIVRRSIPIRKEPVRHVFDEPEPRIDENPFFAKNYIKKNPQKTSQRKPFWSKLFLWAAIFLILFGVVFFVVDHFFSSATVNVTPVAQNAHIDDDLIATKGYSASGVTFQFMSFNEEKTKEVTGTVAQKVQKKATGKVTIFNSYSSATQLLVKNTRLESPDHKIFRLDDAVVVPGAKISGGKVTKPGSVIVSITADAPGSDYNIGLSDFTIPGFKGDPRYSKFIAHSNTDSPLVGGFSGTTKTPTPQDISQAQGALKKDLENSALVDAAAQVPKNFSFFPGSVVLKFEEKPDEVLDNGNTKITIDSTASVFFFDTGALTNKMIADTLPKYTGAALSISNLQTLSFSFVDSVSNAVLTDLTQIHFHLTGDAVFLGTIDSQKLSSDLAGKSKDDFTDIISQQNNIERATVDIFPPWENVFPTNTKRISIKIATE